VGACLGWGGVGRGRRRACIALVRDESTIRSSCLSASPCVCPLATRFFPRPPFPSVAPPAPPPLTTQQAADLDAQAADREAGMSGVGDGSVADWLGVDLKSPVHGSHQPR